MNNGLIIERNFKSVYNGKLFENLNDFQKKFILELFPNISKKDFIICKKYNKEFAKPDITISCNKLEKFISIKSGSSDGMHIKDIKSFILFLRNLGVSTETQKILLLYHYGDGTLDGTGKKRMLHNEIVFKYRNLIEFANKELADTRIVLECLKRFVLQGTSEFMRQIDYIYYGDENGMEGFYITLKDIMENISTAKWTYSNGVYSSKELTDEFLAFTAPCLLDTQNYVQLAGVEIKEDTDGLHLRLLASGTNSGALTVDGVLSEATINDFLVAFKF